MGSSNTEGVRISVLVGTVYYISSFSFPHIGQSCRGGEGVQDYRIIIVMGNHCGLETK